MKTKKKLISLICAFCLVLCLGVFGVLAVTELNLSIGGEIKFSATGVKAKISKGRFVTSTDTANLTDYAGVWQTGADTDKLNAFDVTTSKADYTAEIAKWSGLKLQFNESGDDVYLYFTIQNINTDGTKIALTFTSDVPAEGKNNVKIEFAEIDPIAQGDPVAVFVKFSVANKLVDANLTSFALNFKLEQVVDEVVVNESGQVSNLTSSKYTGVKYTISGSSASVSKNGTPTGAIIIPEKVVDANGAEYPVTTISFEAFSGCKNLTSISIPNSVTAIEPFAFSGCSGLRTINIPSSATSMYFISFQGCSGLESITGGSDAYNVVDNCIIETSTKKLIRGCKNSVIPTDGSVTVIDWEAFSGCTGLTSIIIPSSVTSIDGSAFYGCRGLTSVTISEGVEMINTDAFGFCTSLTTVNIPSTVTTLYSVFTGCTSLTSVTISEGVKSIFDGAFSGCTNLTSITIPSSVTSIGSYAFYNCTALTSIYFKNATPTSGLTGANIPTTATIYVPTGAKSAYEGVLSGYTVIEDSSLNS